MRKCLIFLLMGLLFMDLALAYNIEITDNPIADRIPQNGIAKFELNITNHDSPARDLIITPQQQYGKWRINIPEPYILTIQGSRSAFITITAHPLKTLPLDHYSLAILVSTRDNKFSQEYLLNVNLVPHENKTLLIEIPGSTEIQPGMDETISFKIINTQDYDLNKFKIILESELFREEKTLSIDAKKQKTEKIDVNIEPVFQAGVYKLSAKAYYKEILIGSTESTLKLLDSETQKQGYEVKKSLFAKTITVKKQNNGDIIQKEQIKIEISGFERLFLKTSLEQTSIERSGNKYIYIWNISLEPGQKFELAVSIDYLWFILIIIIALLIILLIALRLAKRIVITKKVINVHRTKEGIRGAKILLHIKNIGPGIAKNLEVIDRLPELIKPGKHYGTIKPKKIEHGRRFNRIIWEIPQLTRGEEQVISYEINSSISILGRFKIPSAYVKYSIGSKRKFATSAKFLFVGSKQD